MKVFYFRRQRILRPLLVSIFQDEVDGDGFGSKFLLKTRFSLKRLSGRRQTILRPSLVLIFQGEADGDGFGPNSNWTRDFILKKLLFSTKKNFKTTLGIDFGLGSVANSRFRHCDSHCDRIVVLIVVRYCQTELFIFLGRDNSQKKCSKCCLGSSAARV